MTRKSPFWLSIILLAGVVALWLLRLPQLFVHYIDPDEFEHLHAIWSLIRGERPYADFFENHPPLLWPLLLPIVRWASDPVGSIFAARGAMTVIAAVTIALVIGIGRAKGNWSVGLWSAFFLSTIPSFFEKTLEIRPDALGVALLLTALLLLQSSFESMGTNKAWREIGVGAALGLSGLCSQKIVPFAFGFVLFALLESIRDRKILRGVGLLFRLFMGSLLPACLLLAWLAYHQIGWYDAWNNLVVIPASWKEELPDRLKHFWPTLYHGHAIFLLAGWGFLRSLLVGEEKFARLLSCQVLAMFAGLLLVRVPYEQYFLLGYPSFCLLAGERASKLTSLPADSSWRQLLVSTILAGVIGLGLSPLWPLWQKEILGPRNGAQLDVTKLVHELCPARGSVLDGFQGWGFARKSALPFYVNQHTIPQFGRSTIAAKIRESLLRDPPTVVILDPGLLSCFDDESGRLIARDYEKASIPVVMVRRIKKP